MCQTFDIGSPPPSAAPSAASVVDSVDEAFAQQVSPDMDVSSEPISEDSPDEPDVAKAVMPIPAVKPTPSLKSSTPLGAKLTQNQRKNSKKKE